MKIITGGVDLKANYPQFHFIVSEICMGAQLTKLKIRISIDFSIIRKDWDSLVRSFASGGKPLFIEIE